jgi:hypothetical protein
VKGVLTASDIVPVKKTSKSSDPAIKHVEDESFEAVFKAKVQQHVKREEKYRFNMSKAYSLLWKQCSRELQDKIEGRTDYEFDIQKKPINLLNATKENSLSYTETRYDMSIISDAVRTLFTIRQKDN